MKLFLNHLFTKALFLLLIATAVTTAFSRSLLDTSFPLENYDQNITTWINPADPSYDQELLGSDLQQKRTAELYKHLFGSLSPWNQEHVEAVLKSDIKKEEEQFFTDFSKVSTYYGEDAANAIPYPQDWLASIKENSNLSQFDSLSYDSSRYGITLTNVAARVLPTEQHAFLNPMLPGEGDTFDYLQMSAVWVGTPVYVIATTQDKLWDLVLTPDVLAWVKSDSVALADQNFVRSWSNAAQQQLVSITKTATPLQDEQGNFFSFAYVGSCFPKGHSFSTMMVPIADKDHRAAIKEISITPEMTVDLPLSLTPHHMADVMSTLIGRPYAWGGIDFNNDCSAELKSLFTPFGIYLPRNSSDQLSAGRVTDKSAALPVERLSFLMENEKPFLSLIYTGGHIILYIGKYSNPQPDPQDATQQFMAMTYQNLWGLRPNASLPSRRAIVGKAALFPLLLQYPEDTTLVSLANKSFFKVCDLSEFSEPMLQSSIHTMSWNLFATRREEPAIINLKTLMHPESHGDR